MSAPEVRVSSLESSARDVSRDDVEMEGGDGAEVEEALEVLDGEGDVEDGEGETVEVEAEAEADEDEKPKLTYIDYLRSPIIEIVVGSDSSSDGSTLLRAHQALLVQSPFFANCIASFSADSDTRRVEFPTEDLSAMGSFLEYLYTGEYFPRRLGDRLELVAPAAAASTTTAATTGPPTEGEQLLRHARVYTLAEKLGVAGLKALAHSKVHLVNTSAKGEIEYARYVYAHTPRTDAAIRKPIAMFWGQRSHVLRHEAEAEFRALCIEFPEFGFDVLSQVLDARERKSHARAEEDGGGGGGSVVGASAERSLGKSGRKRQRHA